MTKSMIANFLLMLFLDTYESDELDYESVDEFYGYIGYTLESQGLLHKFNIESTSELQELLQATKQDNGH